MTLAVMANLPNNPFAELRQLEARVDQRLDMLGRAETNLKSLLDALRHQVTAAFPVVDQLNKLLPDARQQAAEIAAMPDVGSLATLLAEGVGRAKGELDALAGPMRQAMVEDLADAIAEGKAALAAAAVTGPARADLCGLAEAFRVEAKDTLDGVRESLADQLDLLPADAKLRVEPVMSQIDASRREAEASVRTVADAAQADMRRRADQLRQSIDDIAVVLEQRLTQRTAALHQRAEAAMDALRPAMDERLAGLLATLEGSIHTRERELVARIEAYPQRLERQLAEAEAVLMDRIARTERHAADMTAYLEQKLTSRVDDLVARLRLKLQHELNQVAGTPTPEPRMPAIVPAVERPTLEATVFVQSTRRPNLSPAA